MNIRLDKSFGSFGWIVADEMPVTQLDSNMNELVEVDGEMYCITGFVPEWKLTAECKQALGLVSGSSLLATAVRWKEL